MGGQPQPGIRGCQFSRGSLNQVNTNSGFEISQNASYRCRRAPGLFGGSCQCAFIKYGNQQGKFI